MKILVGTRNRKKLEAVNRVCSELLRAEVSVAGIQAESGVPEAPHDQETYQGALNRALACKQSGGADAYVGLESGLVERYGHYFEEAWAVAIRGGKHFIGYSSGLLLPEFVTTKMAQGLLHDRIMAQLDKELNLPNDNRDTWSKYSGGQILRSVSMEEALRNAFIQSIPSEQSLYFKRHVE